MPKQIIWSPLAEFDFANLLDYLDKNWERKVASNFIDLTENILNQISLNPKQYQSVTRGKRSESVFSQNIIRCFIVTLDHE